MRGSDERSGSLFSYVDLEARVRLDHPLRTIREIANAALADLTVDFAALYPARLGRPSIAPERLLRAMLLQAFYGIRSERRLMERMEFDLLFRWFVGLGLGDPAWDHSSFSKNRDRVLEGEIAAPISSSVKRAASSPSIASLARSTAPAMATTSSSTGTATTRAKKPPAMAGPKFRLMALSKARPASQMATTYPSSPIVRLLQRPARLPVGPAVCVSWLLSDGYIGEYTME